MYNAQNWATLNFMGYNPLRSSALQLTTEEPKTTVAMQKRQRENWLSREFEYLKKSWTWDSSRVTLSSSIWAKPSMAPSRTAWANTVIHKTEHCRAGQNKINVTAILQETHQRDEADAPPHRSQPLACRYEPPESTCTRTQMLEI